MSTSQTSRDAVAPHAADNALDRVRHILAEQRARSFAASRPPLSHTPQPRRRPSRLSISSSTTTVERGSVATLTSLTPTHFTTPHPFLEQPCEPEYYTGFLGHVLRRGTPGRRSTHPERVGDAGSNASSAVSMQDRTTASHEGSRSARGTSRRWSTVLDPLARQEPHVETTYDAELATAMLSTLEHMRAESPRRASSGSMARYSFPPGAHTVLNVAETRRSSGQGSHAGSSTRRVVPLQTGSCSRASSQLCSSAGHTTRRSSLAEDAPQLSHRQLTEAFYVRPKGKEMARDAYLHFVRQSADEARRRA